MTLTQRLNLWYGLALFLALVLAGIVVELTSERLASARRTALLEEVEAEVIRAYEAGGFDAAGDVEFPGIELELRDDAGRSLDGVGRPPRPGVTIRTKIVKGVWLHTVLPDAIVQESRRDARIAVGGGGLLVLLLGLGGGLWATQRALAPVREVARAARAALDTGDPAVRVPSPGTGDEIDQMVTVLNRLLQTDQERIEQMRASLDHIGHDLRTPMTRIRASAELALAGDEPDGMASALETAIEEATATEQLLTCLLDLARAEAGMLPLDRSEVDPVFLLQRVAALYEHVAEERAIRLEVADSSAAPIVADQTRLEQALANLVDNAIKFSPDGGVVRLSVQEGDAEIRFIVDDDGPGVPESDRERVFARLVRGDESRGSPGAGLGLAMVRAIAEAHGGTAYLEAAPHRGALAVLALPLRPAPGGVR
ncbi:MAG TPA: HAMP domain-containing histidine kinase [Deltaproteobacteria bacterium]|nr:HAMP domain-containing histidine kinase [Deltaproteobacteria bacterium]